MALTSCPFCTVAHPSHSHLLPESVGYLKLLGGGLFSERPMTRKGMGRFVLEDGLQGVMAMLRQS
jgi:hypothetical protein